MLHPFGNRLFPGDIFRSSQPSSLPLSSVRLRKMSISSVYPIILPYNSRRHTRGTGISNASAWADGRALGQPKARAGWVVVGTTTHTHTHTQSKFNGHFYSQCKAIMYIGKTQAFFLIFLSNNPFPPHSQQLHHQEVYSCPEQLQGQCYLTSCI